MNATYGFGLTNTQQPKSKPCPCGCGMALHPYNDGMPLVCPATWKKAESQDRRTIMLPGSTLGERRTAARRVLELARAIKHGRENAQETHKEVGQ